MIKQYMTPGGEIMISDVPGVPFLKCMMDVVSGNEMLIDVKIVDKLVESGSFTLLTEVPNDE